MDDMDRERNEDKARGQVATCDPLHWMSTEQLEIELFNAIVEDSTGVTDDENLDFDEVDVYFDEADEEDETEQRSSTLRLLALMRPQVVELLGAPPGE